MHRQTGHYSEAAACHRQALELYGDADYRSGQADALMHLGAVQQLTGDYPAAAASLRQALVLFRDLGDRHQQAQVLTELAAVQRLTGDYRSASASSQQALSLYRGRHSSEAAYALNELGLVQQLTGDYPAAAASHQQALALLRTLGDTYQAAVVLDGLGHPHVALGEYEQARTVWREALELYQEHGRDTDADRVRRQLENLDTR